MLSEVEARARAGGGAQLLSSFDFAQDEHGVWGEDGRVWLHVRQTALVDYVRFRLVIEYLKQLIYE
ncbi:MAG: hypothetical protein VR75_08160 [Hyphomonadaceae bacterium BRH_c29]|nr:MAG: hypothetical protein VR75_08160 [Hyphomonadaceae bacterium BRH_c29]